ncbi:hypothetical protein QJQ45_022808 [Haematococcus lacustris]|nr:hypothetical protein QJQ45_022808 [Haematococcus lacustris]
MFRRYLVLDDARQAAVCIDREVEAQPEPSQAQKNKKASGEARSDRHDRNTWHAKKAKRHTVMRGVCAAGLEAGVIVASEVVELRLEVFEEIPAEDAVIPNLAERNLYLQLCRGQPPPGRRSSRPSEAVVEDVLAFYPGLHDRLKAVPGYEHDSNTVDDVGTKLETNFANSLNVLFLRKVEQGVALAGARVIAGSHDHQRRFWLPVDGSPACTDRQRIGVARSVQGKEVTWLEGQEQGKGGVVLIEAMRDEVARQRRSLGLGQGVVVNDAWLERAVNRGSLLRHAVGTSRQLEATNPLCMLPADITLEEKFRSGVAGPKDSEVANRWNAFLPNLAAVRPNVGQEFAQVVHTDGVVVSFMFIRPKPAEPPGELPRMGKEEGAVNPLAHLDADWLGCDPGKTNMATVAHEEQYPSGAVKSVWQRSLTAGQYYWQSGITEHAKESKRYREYADMTLWTWPAMWAELSQRRWSNARFQLYGGKHRTVAKFWAETVKGARVRCNSAATGRPLALAFGPASFSGSGSIGSKGVPVKQMRREACKQFPGRVVLVHEFRTSRVSSARTNVVAAECLDCCKLVVPGAQHSDAVPDPGLDVLYKQCHQAQVLRLRRVSRVEHRPHCSRAGPPTRAQQLTGRPAMRNPSRVGQEWVQVRDSGLLRKWQRRHQQQRESGVPNMGLVIFMQLQPIYSII